VEHISIDINGMDGALPIDLEKPVPFIFLNQFDVITNYGTMEHINNQYQAFKNVHNMCKKGGIIIHCSPLKGHWPGHCRYYYTERFMRGLAKACGYSIFDYTILDKDDYKAPMNLIAVTYIKKENNRFISKKEFDQIRGIIDTGELRFTGNSRKWSDYQ
jgi:SAM-dependent methyltransferase